MVRRWCTFEWFYSAIDYPWFAKREFDEYLNHVGLGHIPRLTRVEWGVIRRYTSQLSLVCLASISKTSSESIKKCQQNNNKNDLAFYVVPLGNLGGFLNIFFMKKGRNLNNIENLLENIILNSALVLGKVSLQI